MFKFITTFLLFSFSNAFNFQGATKPMGYFDPLGFSKDSSQQDTIRLREAELKHGRWGMIAATTIPLSETVQNTPAIHNFDNLSDVQKLLIVGAILAGELTLMKKGWKNPFDTTDNYFKFKDDYQPGDFGFNTLSSDSTIADELLNKELNNGRLAMIAAAGMIAQELVTGRTLF